ncbi:MAG: MBL fold metallo-hydrolase [Bacteroidota bacterium]|nr:MBL fold metallo-hydrolase [Bacteroidota bacterium]MDP4226610.1 MBL fold metallo-hydrolase [Bacteroidota bacterium]MDP4273813.1 MBL fold metallo-hydrolase [Bacteroidota bacterium]
MLKIKRFVFNPIQENTYLVYDETGECVIIDAGCCDQDEQEELSSFILEQNLKPSKLLITHAHADHLLGSSFVCSTYNIPCLLHLTEATLLKFAVHQASLLGLNMEEPPANVVFIEENEVIPIGESNFTAIHVPGHSPGSLAYYNKQEGILFTGDALFKGSIGRTDLYGGSYESLINSIKQKLMILPDLTKVYPGHGPESNIADERKQNTFLR